MTLAPRFRGRLDGLSLEDRRALVERTPAAAADDVRARVREIVARVRAEGDAALVDMARTFDRAELEALEVPPERVAAALDRLAPDVRRALERARRNVEVVHQAFAPRSAEVEVEPGLVVGRRADPLERAGVYAPGGRAAYPSSVLMGAVPARVAGVREIVLASPPTPSGLPSDVVLAAARIAGVDRVFSIGGAGAIAALAFGTESVPRVERIVGPGNAYVAEAKLQVSGVVGIDSPAGPSEILILADHTASPALVARELVAQAEHDPDASVVALVTTEALAAGVLAELARATPGREEIVRAALSARGAVLVATAHEQLAFAAEYAAEHLLLAVADPEATLARVGRAGTVFVGHHASVAFGDYLTGANHVLPTAGLARSFSGLSTLDFVRWTTWQRLDARAAARLADDTALLADAEGLPGHARAARAHGGAP